MSEKAVRYVALSDEPESKPVEKEQSPSKFLLLLKSRKFWAALIGFVMVVVKGFYPDLPLDDELIANIVYILIAYITGTAIEDGLASRRLL